MMVDPAVAFLPDQGYPTFDRGLAADAYLKNPNGTTYKGLVWPGMPAHTTNKHCTEKLMLDGEFSRCDLLSR
jgi:hypothetical protein